MNVVAKTAAPVLLALVVAGGCVGCGGEPYESATLTDDRQSETADDSARSAPASAPPTSSPAPRASEVEGRPDKPAGPEAAEVETFVADYLTELNKALQSGDVEKVQQMYAGGCLSCSEMVNNIRYAYGKGYRVVGGTYTDNKIEAYGEEGGTFMVKVRSLSTAWKQYDQNGTQIDDGPAEKVTYTYGVEKVSGQWQLTAGGKDE